MLGGYAAQSPQGSEKKMPGNVQAQTGVEPQLGKKTNLAPPPMVKFLCLPLIVAKI